MLSSTAAKAAVIVIASSRVPIQELHCRAQQRGKSVVQLFDPKTIISREHILGAYMDAQLAFDERRNIAKSVAMEMLLFAAMTRQISDAIRVAGAKSSSDFVLFCSDQQAYTKISQLLERSSEFKPNGSHSAAAAKRLGLKTARTEAVLQGMALSRLDG